VTARLAQDTAKISERSRIVNLATASRTVSITRDDVSTSSVLASGGMTAEEKSPVFPLSTLAIHAEARAMSSLDIGAADSVSIRKSACVPFV
jgi:hypothetical protein